jgi:hypothetical protein
VFGLSGELLEVEFAEYLARFRKQKMTSMVITRP